MPSPPFDPYGNPITGKPGPVTAVNPAGTTVPMRSFLKLGTGLLATDDAAGNATVLTYTPTVTSFSPDSIVGLVRWHEGDVGLLATSWADQSPVNSPLDQVNGTMTLNAGINGIPGITGSGGNFLYTSRADVAADAARTVFVVHTAAAGNNGLYMTRSQTGICLYGGTDQTAIESNNTVVNSLDANGAAGNHVTEMVVTGITTNKPVIAVDGTNMALTTTGGTGVGSETGSADTRVGRTAGTICAVLVYDSALSAGNRALVRAYLGTKYAITVV